jgi:two-component system, LytTR family, sensor kinase
MCYLGTFYMARYQQHLLFWTAYVLFKAYLNITANVTDFELLPEVSWSVVFQHLVLQLASLVVQVPFVYVVLYLLTNFLSGTSTRIKTVITMAGLFAIGAVAMSFINHYVILPHILHYAGTEFSVFSIGSLVYHSFSLAFVAGLAATFKLMRWQSKARVREMNLQKEKIDAELKYLKGQVNPHFLFNTLNNIYGLARKKSDATAESVLKLSKLMRFMLFDASQSSIRLIDEVKLIEDYISLERLRYADRVNIALIQNIDNTDQEIAPLLLIHFVENAFKHGVSESLNESFVNIDIQLKSNVLKAIIRNSMPEGTRETLNESIGMENIKRQLELLYPEHQLSVEKRQQTFQVTLTIPLR